MNRISQITTAVGASLALGLTSCGELPEPAHLDREMPAVILDYKQRHSENYYIFIEQVPASLLVKQCVEVSTDRVDCNDFTITMTEKTFEEIDPQKNKVIIPADYNAGIIKAFEAVK